MLQELTIALHGCNFEWKHSSLYAMSCGTKAATSPMFRIQVDQQSYVWKPVQSLEALGACIDQKATSSCLMNHRFRAAERLIWRKSTLFFSRSIPRFPKIKAWVTAILPALVHSLHTMHLTKDLLVATRWWENRWLSRIFLVSWRADEGVAGYRSRVSAVVSDMFRKTSALRAHERIAGAVFKEACDDTKPASLIRSDRNEAWRAVVRLESAKRRKQLDLMQSRTGKRMAFEIPFVLLAGPVWRPELVVIAHSSLKSRRNKFIRLLCDAWSIPSTLKDKSSSSFALQAESETEFRISPLTSVNELHLPALLDKDAFWATGFSQLECVTDNRTLADIAVGSALVKSNEHEQVLRSSIGFLERLFSNQFSPRYWSLPPVIWRPREKTTRRRTV